MFADDTIIYYIIKNHDAINIQESLDRFNTRCHDNLLPVNIDKCNAISLTKKKNILYFLIIKLIILSLIE